MERVRAEYGEKIDSYISKIAGHQMQYEELRTLAVVHFETI